MTTPHRKPFPVAAKTTSKTATRAACLAAGLAAFVLGGCTTTVGLDRAILAYDTTTTESIAKQLLLNIARARHNEPMHFTGVSSIAATYRVSFSAGVGAAATGDNGNLLVPMIGAGIEENPTISIAPMEGEEFTQRLLNPFEEEKLALLLQQGYDVDSLLRLVGHELALIDPQSGETTYHLNRPSDADDYRVYRRAMSHLSSIQDRHALQVQPLHVVLNWTVPADSVTPETIKSTYEGFTLTLSADGRTYRVSRQVPGRVMISNYDPARLSVPERAHLHAEAARAPANAILIDIRSDHPGGEVPLYGRLRLRSFHQVLSFLGRAMDEEKEFDVPADPRTPLLSENPVCALEIVESKHRPSGDGPSVRLHGRSYYVQPDDGYQWNKKAFSVLYQLFQMTVSATRESGPDITIAK